MTRAKGEAQRKPITIMKDGVPRPITKDEMTDFIATAEANLRNTFAEQARENGSHEGLPRIYEMYNFSQYADGSVLNAISMKTYTAQEVADTDLVGVTDHPKHTHPAALKVAKLISADLRRNAKEALKNGTTKNLAPRV